MPLSRSACSQVLFAWLKGDGVARVPEYGRVDESGHAGRRRRADQRERALEIHPPNTVVLPKRHRRGRENHRANPGAKGSQRLGPGQVAVDDLGARVPERRPFRARRAAAHEGAHALTPFEQDSGGPSSHKTGGADDQEHL